MSEIKYPIGIQTFEKLREDGFVYVDKTEYIRNLVEYGKIYFLGRPRRFGKSLLLSTIEAFFQGKRELFKGLAIDKWDDWGWEEHAVIHIDLNAKDFQKEDSLVQRINEFLMIYEAKYNVTPPDSSLDGRFRAIILKAFEVTGKQVVVLIDEYDKPILDTLHDKRMKESHRDSLRAFYSTLKSCDKYLKFCFLTGVTKFGQLTLFSGLNNLNDISLNTEFSGICGITEEELHNYFTPGIRHCAEAWGTTEEDVYEQLKQNYDGYHFSRDLLDVYNPWSVLNALFHTDIAPYWTNSGGPMSMLYKVIKSDGIELSDFNNIKCKVARLQGMMTDETDAIPLMYQTGYLTIKHFDTQTRRYTLTYPNLEVSEAFLSGLLPAFTGAKEDKTEFAIDEFVEEVQRGNANAMLKRMKTFFAGFPYENALKTEKDFQNVMYCVMAMMGLQVKVEQHSSLGSADMVVQTEDYVYIFEFKVDKSPDDALRQIEEKGYAAPFANDPRQLIRVGIQFSLTARNLTDWKILK